MWMVGRELGPRCRLLRRPDQKAIEENAGLHSCLPPITRSGALSGSSRYSEIKNELIPQKMQTHH